MRSLTGYTVCRVPDGDTDCLVLDLHTLPGADKLPKWWSDEVQSNRPVLAIGPEHSGLPSLPLSDLSEATLKVAISWSVEHARSRQERDEAKERNNQILAQVTHELRSPITVISLASQLAKKKGLPEEKLHNHLSMIRESSQALQSLVNDILDFSKLMSGTLELTTTEFDVYPFFQNLCEGYKLLAKAKGLYLDLKCGNLPARLRGDPGRLRQVMVNLLSNAIKFTSKGGVTVSVEVQSTHLSEVGLEISVTDTGIGIAQDALDRIFEPYEQADDQTFHQFGGTGLGLSIGKRIAKKMGGHITVESESSRGSTFRLSVRLGRVHSTRRSGSGALTLEGMPILLLQKPGPNREALVDQFKSWGAKVWTAADPLEALRLASSAVAGMLVIKLDDVKFEFVEKMRRQPGLKKSLLVLMATTGQRGDGARCQSLGARAYLSGHL